MRYLPSSNKCSEEEIMHGNKTVIMAEGETLFLDR